MIPAITARLLTDSFHRMVLLSTLIGAASGVLGMYLSYYVDIASGATIVLLQSAVFSLVLALGNPCCEAASLMSGHGLGLAKTRERLQVLFGDRALINTDVTALRFELSLRLPLEDLDAALDAAREDDHAQRADR